MKRYRKDGEVVSKKRFYFFLKTKYPYIRFAPLAKYDYLELAKLAIENGFRVD